MKVYLGICDVPEFEPNIYPCSTRKLAEDAIAAQIGHYIMDCVKCGDIDEAISYVNQACYNAPNDTEDAFGEYEFDGDIYYILEKEMDGEIH